MEPELIPYRAVLSISAHSVVVLAPHPDDEVFGCGGALAEYAHQQVPIHIIVLTDGAGAGDSALRENESRQAAKILGCNAPEFWRLTDRALHYNESLVERLLDTLQQCNADLVFAPSPWEVHPDHRQASMLAMQAVKRNKTPTRLAFYEVGVPLRPNVLLDISSHQETKQAAMRCFASQLVRQDYSLHMTALNVYRTYTLSAEVQAAEAYWLVSSAQLTSGEVARHLHFISPGIRDIPDPLSSTLPLVSVLIRSLDRDYLARALDSVGLQTYPRIEVLVIAARPGHRALPEYCGPFPIALHTTLEALPRSRAANKALSVAHGELLLLLDDDDWLMPDHIAKLAQVLARQPQTLAVYTGITLVDAHDRPLGQVFDMPFDAVRQQAGNLTPIHAVLFRSHVRALGLRFDEALDRFEDWDFWLRLARLGTFAHLPGVSGVYRVHDSSGVHEDAGPLGEANQHFYRMWKERWSSEDLGKLMQRVWDYSDLEVRVLAAEAQAQAQDKELRPELAEQAARIDAMTRSISWRITSPLRALGRTPPAQRWVKPFLRKLRSAHQVWREEGLTALLQRVHASLTQRGDSAAAYQRWVRQYEGHVGADSPTNRLARLTKKPLISVVMPVYDPPIELLRQAIDSVVEQQYPHWELCIADDTSPNPEVARLLRNCADADKRIKLVIREENGHISAASNSALDLATGDYVALLDHDDLLAPDALLEVAFALERYPDARLLYSDEDKIDIQGQRHSPHFKSGWNPELFLSQNYLSHLGVFHRLLVQEVGGFRAGYEGAQDYDLALRCVLRIHAHQIVHIPKVLYHWRALLGSTALGGDEKPYAQSAGERALIDYLRQSGTSDQVECLPNGYYRILPAALPHPMPLVSMIVPTRNAHRLVQQCISSILEKTTYPRYEILLVDNGSDDPEALSYFAKLAQHPRIRVLHDASPFNFSALNNRAAREAQGELIGLINNDVEVIRPDWLTEMVALALRKGVGAVGARLWYPNHTLQHGGIVVGLGGVAGHSHLKLGRDEGGYFGRAQLTQAVSAVTAACLLVRASSYWQVGGLEETHLAVAFNDVDFCLKLGEAGYRNIWTPYAELFHHESATRGQENTPQKRARFANEVAYMQQRWGERLSRDPYYNPNLSLVGNSFTLAWPPRITDQKARVSAVTIPQQSRELSGCG